MTRSTASLLVRTAIILASGILLAESGMSGQNVPPGQLGPAPRITDWRQLAGKIGAQAIQAVPAIDPSNRQQVVDLYNAVYIPAAATPNDWNGSAAGCNPGTTSATYTDATIDMVNYFRAMTQLPPVTHEALKNAKSQQAALMMTANNNLSHFPPTTWKCYTAEGAEAAGKSNLALGTAGAQSVARYIADHGANNTALGHRRWILYPRQVELGTGSTSNANAMWVIGTFGARPSMPEIIAWPPVGYVPYTLAYPRWSFSLNTASSVNLSGAVVSMTRSSGPVALTILPYETGFGDNTLAWEPSGLSFTAGAADQVITVRVSNVIIGGLNRTFDYSVTVIDPAVAAPPTFTDHPLVPTGTRVKAVHITELRSLIGSLRTRYGLPSFGWTDPSLMAGVTTIKAAHVTDLRAALAQAYVAAGRTPPAYTSATITSATTVIRVQHIAELRAAVLALW